MLWSFFSGKYFAHQFKSSFSTIASPASWNTTSDESFRNDALSEINFIGSTKESENKIAECIFCNEKCSEDERGNMWIICFCCSLLAQLDCTGAQNME